MLTGGTIATMIVVPILLVACAIAAAKTLRIAREERGSSDREAYWVFRIISTALIAAIPATLALTWWGMYPWKAEYHTWTDKSGVVDTVDSRLVSTGNKTMEDKYVVKFRDSDQQYGVLDTRAAGLKPGDHLSITCVRIWQYSGTDGYDCNFVSLERAR